MLFFSFLGPSSATQDVIRFFLIPSWHPHLDYSSSFMLIYALCFFLTFRKTLKMIELKANWTWGCVLNEHEVLPKRGGRSEGEGSLREKFSIFLNFPFTNCFENCLEDQILLTWSTTLFISIFLNFGWVAFVGCFLQLCFRNLFSLKS